MASQLLTRAELELLVKKNDSSIKLKKVQQMGRSSSLWPRFSLVFVNDVAQEFALCDKCRSIITYKSATGTGGLKKHLASCEKDSSSNTTQSSITTYYQNKKSPILSSKIRKEITDAYLDFVVLDSRPFGIANGVGFQRFLQVVFDVGRPSSNTQPISIVDVLPHQTTVSRKIDEMYDFRKKQLVSWCRSLDFYTVIVDMWTEKFSGVHFCGVSLRTVDSDFYLHSFCLGCKPYTLENQTAPNIRKFIDNFLLDYGLSLNSNSFIVTDNEPKMLAALRGANRVGCSDHYLNKILEHSFTITKSNCIDIIQTFDVIKSLVSNFRRSHKQVKLSRKLQTFSPTRFSGAYYMMNVFNSTYNELVDVFSGSHYDDFESVDKDLLSQLCSFLELFDQVITTLSDETQPTLHQVIPLRIVLMDHCVPKGGDSSSIKKLKQFLQGEINNDWPIQPEHLLSTILHPCLRDFCGNQSLKDQAILLLKSSIVSANSTCNINSSANDSSVLPNMVSSINSLDNTSSINSSLAPSSVDKPSTPRKANILSLCFDKPRAAQPAADEVLLWLQGDFHAEITDNDILGFWRRKKLQFPMLASIARKVLAIPASNTSVERLFSLSKITIGDRRTRLGTEKIDKLMFLKKNLTSLKQMFDLKNDLTTIISKRKPEDVFEVDDDDCCNISKKIKANEEHEYYCSSDDYESEKEN